VECIAVERFKKAQKGNATIAGTLKFPLITPKEWHRLPDGWCAAHSVKEGDVSECLKVAGKNEEIGNCKYCGHYRPDNPGIRAEFLDAKAGKSKVDADSRYLIKMIELVRKGIGHAEDIGAALLRLQRSSNHYSKCLWEKYSEGGNISWQDQEN
jgi:hypothetical protein